MFGVSVVARSSRTVRRPLRMRRATSVVGDAAYAVVPVRIAYRQRGKDVVENGAWTFALRNTGGRWKIVSAAFAPATP